MSNTEQLPRGYWLDEQNVLREIAAWRAENDGRFPTMKRLGKTGHSSLAAAISKHGGYHRLRELVGETQARSVNGHWQNFENVRAWILSWQDEHGGKFPSKVDLDKAGHAGIGVAISRLHGGFPAVRRRMGDVLARERMPFGHWREFENVAAAILAWSAANDGRFPSYGDLELTSLSGLKSNIARYHGGTEAVRDRLGFGPITDEAIAAHADALARIVPAVGSPSTLWSAMKSRWTARDLDAAVARYESNGSVERFRTLADG